MTCAEASPQNAGLGDFIEAYESAQARDGWADLMHFLPEPEHQLYPAVARELVRVDLEYGWRRGRPPELEHYRRLFPELFQDPRGLGEIAFEEYRLRQQAGQNPLPAEYRQRYGVDTRAWPGPEFAAQGQAERSAIDHGGDISGKAPSPPDTSGPQGVRLEEAARTYQEFRRLHDAGDVEAIDAWQASFPGNQEYAQLFRDMHRSDAQAAYRLAQAITTMPEVGAELLGFRLVAELGRGTFGRVFLAQPLWRRG